MEFVKRKTIRLWGYDYDSPGCYFITLCTQHKQKLLCDIVVENEIDGPTSQLLPYGMAVQKHLDSMQSFYGDIFIEKSVIMPNHVHLLLRIPHDDEIRPDKPLIKKDRISRFVGTLKRFCNKDCGENIWQYRSYDHIIRDERDYQKIWNYIDHNPGKWTEDGLFVL